MNQSETYGLHPMFQQSKAVQPKKIETFTPLQDRTTNAEATTLGFLAEKSLPFSLAPDLVDYARAMSKDKAALGNVNISRISASYKMKYGLSKTFQESLIDDLQHNKFSLNIDEATSSNLNKVLGILVSYYSPALQKVVIQHLASITVVKVTSESLYKHIVDVLESNKIPWSNLMSILMDSCAVMRGPKAGLETLIRTRKAPHLLDIDGDSCHHAQNAAKVFCKPFDRHVERLLTDLYNDFKWSPDMRELLEEICIILGLKYTMPQRYVSHRWLSVFDCSIDLQRLFDAYILLYFSFVPKHNQTTYLAYVVEIYKRCAVSKKAKERVKQIHVGLAKKNMTPDGIERKRRIVNKLFYHKKQTKLEMYLYLSVLPMLKKYVLLFEVQEPLIHKMFDQQVNLMTDFMACFVKPEALTQYEGKKLVNLDVEDNANILKPKSIFLGQNARNIVALSRKDDSIALAFQIKAKSAYIACGKYLQKKMPITNRLLQCISALDPICFGHTSTLNHLLSLPDLVKNVLQADERDKYNIGIRKLQSDKRLPSAEGIRMDDWWTKTSKLDDTYNEVFKMAVAVLGCFHGPQIESSFSIMTNVLDSKSSRKAVSTYSAIMTVRYQLKSQTSNKSGSTALQYFVKKDHLHDPVDDKLCSNMRCAYKDHKAAQEAARESVDTKNKNLDAPAKKAQSKRKAREECFSLAKKTRLDHVDKLVQRALKRKSSTKK